MLLLMFAALVLSADPSAKQVGDNSDFQNALEVRDAQVKLIREVRLPVREAGVITRLSIREGDLVNAGEVVGQTDNSLVSAEKKLAELEKDIALEQSKNDIDFRYAKKSLAVAQAELRLSEESVQRVADSISETELNRLKLVVEQSSLAAEKALHDSRIAKLTANLKQQASDTAAVRVDRRKLIAPLSGMAVELFKQEGEFASAGEPVCRIIRLDRMRVEAHVDASRYGAPQLQGKRVRLTVNVPPGKPWQFFGHVTFVSPEVQPVTGQVRIWAEVENAPGLTLRPGVHGVLHIATGDDSTASAASDKESLTAKSPSDRVD